jgi:hypothetical protein
MKWVTRARPKTDRIACPWLIRRFIDPDAEFLYVPADQVQRAAETEGARSFDAQDAEFTHRADKCTFEVLIDDFDLGGDAALARLAKIVHAADIESDLHTDPAGPDSWRSVSAGWTPKRRPSTPRAGPVHLRRPLRLVRPRGGSPTRVTAYIAGVQCVERHERICAVLCASNAHCS